MLEDRSKLSTEVPPKFQLFYLIEYIPGNQKNKVFISVKLVEAWESTTTTGLSSELNCSKTSVHKFYLPPKVLLEDKGTILKRHHLLE